MSNALRKQNLERLQREQKILIEPARIKRKTNVEQDLSRVRVGISEVSLQSPIEKEIKSRKSQRARIRKSLQDTQRRLVKKNGLNKNVIF